MSKNFRWILLLITLLVILVNKKFASSSFLLLQYKTTEPLNHNGIDLLQIKPSLLVVVTGGWAMKRYRDDQHYLYLEQILANYVSICEAGFHVSVILVSYEGSEDNYIQTMPISWFPDFGSSKFICHQIGRPISVSVELYPFRPLPEGAFGTSGDLAIPYREIFHREQNNFDFFLVQEDDVSYDIVAVQYLLTYIKV
jgi:hypothetical protein